MKGKGVSESHKSELSSLPGASAYPGSGFLSLEQNTNSSFSEIARKLVWFRKLLCADNSKEHTDRPNWKQGRADNNLDFVLKLRDGV